MKRKSWLIALLMAAILVVSGIPALAENTEPVTITFWNSNQGVADVMDAMAAEYHEKTGNTVEITCMESAAYKEKLAIAMASGDLPDVFQHWGDSKFFSYVDAGRCYDLTELVNESGAADVWLDTAMARCTVDGKIYSMPGLDMMVFPLCYNKDIFAQYGYTDGNVPQTLPELEALCDKLVADGYIPFALANLKMWTGGWYYSMLLDRIGGTSVIDDIVSGAEGASFESEPCLKAAQKLVEWVNKGYFPDGFNGLDHSAGDDRQLLYAGVAAMWSQPSIAQLISSENPEMLDTFDVMNMPWGEAVGVGTNAVVGSIGSNYFSINAATQHIDAAYEFLTMFGQDTYLNGLRAAKYNPPTKDYTNYVSLDIAKRILGISGEASSVQLAWDQYLPASVGSAYNEQVQALLGGTMTPEEFCATLQGLMEDAAA